MNFASWIILAIVLVVVGLAVRATFFGKKGRGSCCDVGDADKRDPGVAAPCECASAAKCAGCSGCSGAVALNALQPIIREQGEENAS